MLENMFPQSLLPTLTPLLILALALFIDITVGEPPEKFHLTVWIGKTINFFKPRLKTENPVLQKINGIILGLLSVTLFVATVQMVLFVIGNYCGFSSWIVASALFLKMTFAIKCMEDYALPIANALRSGNLFKAKQLLRHIVRRDASKLSESQTVSAAVESIAEGTVDGITSPLFYFAIFGVPGAVAFRVINTLDSLVGYKDPEHVNIGWFSARLDTLSNYIPARLTAFLMIIVAWLLNQSWRNAWRTLARDKDKTESLNAGWPMAAMAGLLNVRLEKPGSYVLGDPDVSLSPEHILRALYVMKITTVLFLIIIIIPTLVVLATLRM